MKNSLNDERARHAGTADQARALTHVAAQLRAKSEKLENTVMKQNETIKIFQKVKKYKLSIVSLTPGIT